MWASYRLLLEVGGTRTLSRSDLAQRLSRYGGIHRQCTVMSFGTADPEVLFVYHSWAMRENSPSGSGAVLGGHIGPRLQRCHVRVKPGLPRKSPQVANHELAVSTGPDTRAALCICAEVLQIRESG